MDTKLIAQLKDTDKELKAIDAEIMNATVQLQKRKAALMQTDSEVRAAIKEAMISTNTKKFDSDDLTITLVAASTRKSLDITAIKENDPELYEKYLKETQIAPSVRINLKSSI